MTSRPSAIQSYEGSELSPGELGELPSLAEEQAALESRLAETKTLLDEYFAERASQLSGNRRKRVIRLLRLGK